jgi:signal recognition particle GTPase
LRCADPSHTALLSCLSPVKSAFHNAYSAHRECLNGTREALLGDIKDWFEDDSSESPFAFWLSGIAGTGKTTVSHSVCAMLSDHLGASFFFSRDEEERRRPSLIFPTIAYQLAMSDPVLKKHVCDAIAKDEDVASKAMAIQVRQLVTEAFQSVPASYLPRRKLIVIDALDECHKERDREGGDFIPLLVTYFQRLRFKVKVFVTSRPEHSIQVMFGEPEVRKPTRQCVLHNIEEKIVQADIELYIRHEFAEIARRKAMEPGWPTEEEIKQVAGQADRLFIYASTVVKSVRDGAVPPKRRLRAILSVGNGGVAGSLYGPLDSLYSWILNNMASMEEDKTWIYEMFQKVVGAIIVLQQPQSFAALSALLGVEEDDVDYILRPLRAVFDISENVNEPIRTFHQSFPDYVTDRDRCKDTNFCISTSDHHAQMAYRCLQIMNSLLKRNICSIEDPSLLNAEIAGLESLLEASTPAELRYACRYWITHTILVSRADNELMQQLETFCRRHLLHWLEALSLLGHLRVALEGLPLMLTWMKVGTHGSLLLFHSC